MERVLPADRQHHHLLQHPAPVARLRTEGRSRRSRSHQDPQGHLARLLAQHQPHRKLRLHDQLDTGRHRSPGSPPPEPRLLAPLHDRSRGGRATHVKIANFTFSRRWAKITNSRSRRSNWFCDARWLGSLPDHHLLPSSVISGEPVCRRRTMKSDCTGSNV
jgi:hypothetical protein